MNLNLTGVVMVFAGAILIYSAVKRKDPRNVILEAIGSKKRVNENSATGKNEESPKKSSPPPSTGPTGYGPIVSV